MKKIFKNNDIIKNINLSIILIILLIITCFLALYYLTVPSFLERFNQTSTGNIGSAIGGITAPILGITSLTFLFITLIKQIKSNEKTRLKNESDIIFLLINQFDLEYDKFYFTYSVGTGKDKIDYKFTGYEGINVFVSKYAFEWKRPDFPWATSFVGKQISLLIKSYSLIDKRIQLSQLDKQLKELFYEKIKSIYVYKLHEELKNILRKCNELNQSDELIIEMQFFVNYYTNKYELL